MKNIVFSLATVLLLMSCDTNKSVEVYHKGALRNMMHKGDLSAKADLRDLKSLEHLYGLGAIKDLKGEILIMDSQPFLSSCFLEDSVKHNRIDKNYDAEACLLVYAQVEEWESSVIPAHIKSYEALEEYIHNQAQVKSFNMEKPFPFMLKGQFASMDWHVIDWKDGDTEHSHEKHIQSGLYGTQYDVSAEMLGFYSTKHHAIFTHHTTNMHIHSISNQGKRVAHVDNLTLDEQVVLLLPVLGN